ncbi:MAG: BMC domain-containing protein [Clostridia bacterium]|nr:BMC domain-containing protein [Clostridia bacterium]MBQ2249245.1 BMC domain-containing protein [Clostridia bacterium]MBQ5612916.1 BMC domain-containing protein [Clostridia bacterium]MBQ5662106.1 BMC domain-containing protein [Clostridia bacterium]MBQ5772306.1 BMC domain-containing protein [Clostridia bacterium]
MANAVGMIEVYGLVAAFAACDAGCKAANVTVEPFDKNKPANPDGLPVPLQVLVKFRGSVENVTAAVAAAEIAVNEISGVVTKHIIAAMDDGSEKMLKLNAFDKK